MLIMLAESRSLRRKLVRHPADAGGYLAYPQLSRRPRGFAKQIGLSAMSRGMGHMATVGEHLSVEELEARYVGGQLSPHRGISR